MFCYFDVLDGFACRFEMWLLCAALLVGVALICMIWVEGCCWLIVYFV